MGSPGVFRYVDTDEKPDLGAELEGEDISQFASITLRVRLSSGKLLTKAAIVDDSPNGLFHFEFDTGDLIAGIHKAEVVFAFPDGKTETVPDEQPIDIIVRKAV